MLAKGIKYVERKETNKFLIYLIILLGALIISFSIPLISFTTSPVGRFSLTDIYDVQLGDSIIFDGRNITLKEIIGTEDDLKVKVNVDGLYSFIIPLPKNKIVELGNTEAELIEKVTDSEIKLRISQKNGTQSLSTSKIMDVTLRLESIDSHR